MNPHQFVPTVGCDRGHTDGCPTRTVLDITAAAAVKTAAPVSQSVTADAPQLQEAFKKQLVSVKPNASLEEAQSWLDSELAAWRKTVAEVKIDLSD